MAAVKVYTLENINKFEADFEMRLDKANAKRYKQHLSEEQKEWVLREYADDVALWNWCDTPGKTLSLSDLDLKTHANLIPRCKHCGEISIH